MGGICSRRCFFCQQNENELRFGASGPVRLVVFGDLVLLCTLQSSAVSSEGRWYWPIYAAAAAAAAAEPGSA